MTISLFITVIAFALFVAIKNYAPNTQSAAKESAKSLLLKVSQIIGLLAGFGVFAQIGIFPKITELLSYINMNIDSTWDMVVAVIEVFLGAWAIIKPSVDDAEARIQSARQL